MKRWFDPWPVFFKREFNRTWPFLVGFAVTGTIITKFSLGLTEEDAKNSPFAQKHKRLPFSAGGVEVQVATGPPVAFQNYLFPTVRSRERVSVDSSSPKTFTPKQPNEQEKRRIPTMI
ncbi:hypothetical protein PVK06_014455 [Gossypium arboreum]|uniref:Uncharacterized protein n=1 Tax=Gossypium arboreum TaxID=29729 RepID=A0ABR0PUP3_GOSAR|nr:hypothetical protein PVK06_014455 [Gossypium arboreum]